MKYEYACIEQHLYHEDIGNYISYGIFLTSDTAVRVDDVSTDYEFVKDLVFLLNEHQASPTHLLDIIEDFLP